MRAVAETIGNGDVLALDLGQAGVNLRARRPLSARAHQGQQHAAGHHAGTAQVSWPSASTVCRPCSTSAFIVAARFGWPVQAWSGGLESLAVRQVDGAGELDAQESGSEGG